MASTALLTEQRAAEPAMTLAADPASAPASGKRHSLTEVLQMAVERARLRQALAGTWAVIRHFIAGEVAARDPRLSPKRVWALFLAMGTTVPETLPLDPVAATTWRLEAAITAAQQELPAAGATASLKMPATTKASDLFWRALAATYPELSAALQTGEPRLDVIARTVRGSHEQRQIRAVTVAIREDFEARLVEVFKGGADTWRAGILAAIDEAVGRSLAVGMWAGQLGLAKVPPPSARRADS
jgi:hypothetical protein